MLQRQVLLISVALGVYGCSKPEASESGSALARVQQADSVRVSSPLVLGSRGGNVVTAFGPSGTANTVTAYQTGSDLALGDIDNDGADEVVIGRFQGAIQIFERNGTQVSFPSLSAFSFTNGSVIGVGDLDGDHFDDIVLGQAQLSGQGQGVSAIARSGVDLSSFFGGPGVHPAFPFGSKLTVCDLNNDGFDEVIVAPGYQIYAHPLHPVGTFFATQPQVFALNNDKIACNDLNNDGFDDLVIAHAGPANDPNSGFLEVFTHPSRPVVNYFPITSPRPTFQQDDDLAVGDLDLDGSAEVIIGRISLQPGGGGDGSGALRIFSPPGKSLPPFFPFGSATYPYLSGDSIAIGSSTSLTCVPTPELCDGQDNDCNGVVDDGPAETCDGVDNDCDGMIDDGLPPGTCTTEVGPPWRSLGPRPLDKGIGGFFDLHATDPSSGRATSIAVNPSNPYNVWIGTAGGGVWVTGDARIGGLHKSFTPGAVFDPTWEPQFFPLPARLESHAIGSVLLDQCSESGCNVAFIGTGENSLRRDTYYGNGVFRVTFGATTWSAERLDTSQQFLFGSVAEMVLDQGELFVALHPGNATSQTTATVRAPTPAAGYGIHRRRGDGSWSPSLLTGANGSEAWASLRIPTDIEKDPGNANGLFAGVMNDGIYRSTNRGDTWCAMNPGATLPGLSATDNITACSTGTGLPTAGTFDHVQVAVLPGSTRVYALFGNCPSAFVADSQRATQLCLGQVVNPESGVLTTVPLQPFLFRSDNGGQSFASLPPPYPQFVRNAAGTLVGNDSNNSHYSRYTTALAATNGGTDLLYGGVNVYWFTNNGLTSLPLDNKTVHPDFHDLVVAPVNAAIPGTTGTKPVFYAVNDGGFFFFNGGTGEWHGGNANLATTQFFGIGIDQLAEPDSPIANGILGGLQDNGTVLNSTGSTWETIAGGDGGEALIQSQSIVYTSAQNNSLQRRPGAAGAGAASVAGNRLGSEADAAFYSSYVQHEATKRLYVATDVVSIREGATPNWATQTPAAETISPVLGEGNLNFPAIESARNILTAIAISESDEWRIYVGTYNGRLFRTAGGTKPTATQQAWPEVTSNLPRRAISSIAVHPTNRDDVWVTISDFIDDTLWHSTNGGGTWTATGPRRPNGFPEPSKMVKVDPRNPSRIWLGTDTGVYLSENNGATWIRRSANLPSVPVFDIEIDRSQNRVLAATHGRGVWGLFEGGPVLTTQGGCTQTSTDSISVQGNGFTCTTPGGCSCTLEVLRDDGSVCATSSGSLDAQGRRLFVPQGGSELRTEDTGACQVCEGRGVGWACFNGQCAGNTNVSACNQSGHFLASVRVSCAENAPASGSAPGTCADQTDPVSSLFQITPAPSAAPPTGTRAITALALLTASGGAGSRTLCSADVTFSASAGNQQIQLAVRDALNTNAACVAAGVTASLLDTSSRRGEDIGTGQDLRLALRGRSLSGRHLVLGVGIKPGAADQTCLSFEQLGSLFAGQLGPTSLRFVTAPGGAAGGSVLFEERSSVGTCAMKVATAPGQHAAGIAAAIGAAFSAPGTPSPLTCGEGANPRDLTVQADAVSTTLARNLQVCLFDSSVGLAVGPPGIKVPVRDAEYKDLALLSAEIMTLGERMIVRRTNGTPAAVGNLSGPTVVKWDSELGDLLSVGRVELWDRVHVRGSARSGGAISVGVNVQVDQGSFPNTDVNLPPLSAFAVGFPATNQGDASVAQGATRTLAPGSYTTANLATSSTLNLRSGTYYFRSLSLEPSSRLLLDQTSGPIFVYVRDSLTYRGAVQAVGGGHPNLLLDYLGTATGIIEKAFFGALVAPNARLWFSANVPTTHRGSAFARHLQFEPDVTYEHVPFAFSLPLAATAAGCSDALRNGDESDVDCGGTCAANCIAGGACRSSVDCISNVCTGGICQGGGTCTEATATDLGQPGAMLTVANNGCVRIRDGYPSWWGTRSVQFQTTSPGIYPTSFNWSNTCAPGSGTNQFTADNQSKVFGPTKSTCATVIDLLGNGAGQVTLRYYGN